MTQQILNLQIASFKQNKESPRRNTKDDEQVHFEQSLCTANEEEKLESYVVVGFKNDIEKP